MKRTLLLCISMAVASITLGQQQRTNVSLSQIQDHQPEKDQPGIDGTYNFSLEQTVSPNLKSTSWDEDILGMTRHDNQTSYAPQNRLHLFPDGKIGATWMYGINNPDFLERGTGYNFFNGTAWGPEPTARIESVRTGWPSYAPYGANGELVVAHTPHPVNTASSTLTLTARTNKGAGAWTTIGTIDPPLGAGGIVTCRMITSGANRTNIHIIVQTTSSVVYQGMSGALLYYRSLNGGTTWDISGVILPGMNSNFYPFITGDQYTWIEPRGNHLAFLAGARGLDFFMMESFDNGTTWVKKMIWKNPYNGDITTTVAHYCADGSFHGAIDKHERVHVAFGLNRKTGTSWYPTVGGLAYWNTNMAPWLNTYDNTLHPDSVAAMGRLIYRNMDFDGDGVYNPLTGNAAVGYYYIGTASMPQIMVDNDDDIFLVFSAMSDINNTQKNYRKLVGMSSPDGGVTWSAPVHLTSGFLHMYDECVFPSLAPSHNGFYHLIYQTDENPGLAMRGGGSSPAHAYCDNFFYYMKIPKSQMVGVANPKPEVIITRLSQNYPNPVRGNTAFDLTLDNAANVMVSVFNMMGQKVMECNKGYHPVGTSVIQLNMTGYKPGLYFYTVSTGSQTMSRRMIVE